MLEIVLILGLIFVLGMLVLQHIGATVDIPWLNEMTDLPPDRSLHPWYITAEVVILLTIIYIVQHI